MKMPLVPGTIEAPCNSEGLMQRKSLLIFPIAGLLAFLAASCGTSVLRAPFPYVPTTVTRGDLRGPYSGRVLALGTDKPVSQALVVATWSYCKGVGFCIPAGFSTYKTTTDRDGRYYIPTVDSLKGPYVVNRLIRGVNVSLPGPHGSPPSNGVLSAFRLLIYKKGYVAYRSDRLFPEGEFRMDFAQRDNLVKLEQWSPDMSHLTHIRFIGALHLLEKKALWELHGAQAELEGKTARPVLTVDETKLLDVSELLTEDDLEELLKAQGPFEVGRLRSVPRTASTDSIHFKAAGRKESYDLAFRVYKIEKTNIEAYYLKLLKTYPNAKPVDQVGDRSFTAFENEILAHVFMDRKALVVILLTCGAKLCTDAKQVLAVAKLIHSRLDRMKQTKADKPRKLVPDQPTQPAPRPFVPARRPSYIPRLNP